MANRKEYRKQHTVPKSYLNNFTDTNGSLWMMDTKLNVYRNAPKNTLTKDSYYDVQFQGKSSLIIEKGFLGTLEGQFAQIYKDKISKKIRLTEEEKGLMSIFIAAQLNRVPGRRDAMLDFINRVEEMTKPFIDMTDDEKEEIARQSFPAPRDGDSIPVEELLKMRDTINSDSSAMLPGLSFDIAPMIFSMNWGFMYYEDGDNFFFTSDDPCTMVNPDFEQRFGPYNHPGLIQDGVELMMPLSPTISVLCGWRLEQDLEYIPVNDEMVNQANQRHLRHGSLIITNGEKVANAVKQHIIRRRQLSEIKNVLSKPLMDIHDPIIRPGDLD